MSTAQTSFSKRRNISRARPQFTVTGLRSSHTHSVAHCGSKLTKPAKNKLTWFHEFSTNLQPIWLYIFLFPETSRPLLLWFVKMMLVQVQGVSKWNGRNWMPLRDRRINIFLKFGCLVASGGVDIWVSSICFQKSNIDRPQQPLAEKVLKFNMIFYDSTQKKTFPQNKKIKLNSNVLSSVFSGLKTSAASMTPTTSFHQKIYWSWWFDHP